MTAGSYRAAVISLLIIGSVYWAALFGPSTLGTGKFSLILLSAGAALISSIRLRISRGIEWINRILILRRCGTAFAVAILMAGCLLSFAWIHRGELFLSFSDEHAYMIQARMLARGKLWHAPYPPNVAPCFDALSMIVDRVYAAMYFPGTALAMAPFVWLGLPFWAMSITAASVAAGLLYSVAAQIFDPARGLAAVIMLAATHVYRESAVLLLAQMPFLAGEMGLLWAWMRFGRAPRLRYAMGIGALGGYCAITRPMDAACAALPIGAAVIAQLWPNARQMARTLFAICAAALPFLILLAIQNRGVTGRWSEFAETYYNRENFPASPLGFWHPDTQYKPRVLNAVKQQWLNEWVMPSFERHTAANAFRSWYRGRLRETVDLALPNPIFVVLVPVALLGICELRRAVVAAIFVIFAGGYAIYLFFLDHYVVSILPSVICIVLIGWEVLRRAWPAGRVDVFIACAIAGVSLAALCSVWSVSPSNSYPEQRAANQAVANLPLLPAVVLFRFDPKIGNFSDDPVYNDDVAWPDGGTVIRARDLGVENDRAIITYYARRQPDRIFYIYDPDARVEGRSPISPPLGTAKELERTVH